MSRVVADASNTLRHRVLHIRLQPPSSLESGSCRSPLDKLLAASPLETEWCPDVYRGLARLFGPPSAPPRAVIVCLDGLGTPEFEFFSILSRVRRDLKVYVYGSAGAEARIAKAVEFGATGSVTKEVLSELAGGPPPLPEAEAPVRTPERRNDTAAAPADPPPDPADQTPMRMVEEEDARKPARVPWLRYGDRPARVAPAARTPAPQPSPSVDRPSPRTTSFEPLLTEEELQALMSDDIAAIAADEPDARRPHDDDPTRGVP